VEFLLENPPCKQGQPPDILLKSALSAEKGSSDSSQKERHIHAGASLVLDVEVAIAE
jgi:hypothetical protein